MVEKRVGEKKVEIVARQNYRTRKGLVKKVGGAFAFLVFLGHQVRGVWRENRMGGGKIGVGAY